MSATCTTLPSSATRPATDWRPGTIVRWRRIAQCSVVEAVIRHIAIDLAIAHQDRCAIASAKPRGGFADRVEDRLNIEAGPADDLEHVAGRGLVFERLLQILEEPRILGTALVALGMALVEPP